MEDHDLIKAYVRAMLESRLRETDVTDGSRVSVGSEEHVEDLDRRIKELEMWRDRERRGSAARAEYARLISRLRGQRRSAERYSEKQTNASLEKGEVLLDEE